MEYLRLMRQPNINMVAGIKVNKDTEINFENDKVKQSIKDLVYHGITKIKGDNFEGTNEITVNLKEGDYVVFDGEDRGYFVPAERLMTVAEAIEELKCVLTTTSAPEEER